MRRNAIESIWVLGLLLGLTTALRGSDDFATAHSLAAKLWEQRVAATTKETREALEREMGETVARIQALASRGVVALLNSANPPSTEKLQERLRLALSPTDEPQTGDAAVLELTEPPAALYVVAYAVGYCPICSRSRLEVLGLQEGRYQDLASSQDPLPNKSVALIPLGELRGGIVRFLAHGVNWGDPHGRMTVIAFAYEGKSLRSFWSRGDLPQGIVRVEGDRIIVTYLTSLAPPWREPRRERTDVYRFTGGVIKLQATTRK